MVKQIADQVSSDKAKEIYTEQLLNDHTRKHVLSIVEEYANSVPFMERVRKYAGAEIDSRLFTSVKFWALTVTSAVVSSAIGLLIGKLVI